MSVINSASSTLIQQQALLAQQQLQQDQQTQQTQQTQGTNQHHHHHKSSGQTTSIQSTQTDSYTPSSQNLSASQSATYQNPTLNSSK
jgi:sRNA-binding protein